MKKRASRENHDVTPFKPDLRPSERKDIEQRASPRAVVVHETVRKEGEEELQRPLLGLAWSGLAGGLSMGLSLVAQGLLRHYLPEASWSPLITKLGYSVGFLVVVLGRQQLFTENTVRAVLPLLSNRTLSQLVKVARLWVIVLAANLVGALGIAWVLGNTGVFEPGVKEQFARVGLEAMQGDFGTILLEGVFAGWLIAVMVWMLPVAEANRVAIVIIISYMVGLGGFAHVVAGSIDVLYLVTTSELPWEAYIGGYLAPTLLGNAAGGVALVAMLNHAQVVAGERESV